MSEFRRDVPCLLGFLALVIAFFGGIIFRSDGAVVGALMGDLPNLFVPMRYYAYYNIARGVLPFWNPYIFCGVPFLADPFSAMFYPINLIFLLLPVNLAVNYSVMAQMTLSGVFFYYCARCFSRERVSAFIASLVYMFGATQVCHIFAGHLCFLSTMIWLPLLFLLTEKYFRTWKLGYVLAAGAALAIQIFASHMQVVFYGCIAILLYCAFRGGMALKDTGRLKECLRYGVTPVMIVAVGLSLAAVQLCPAVEFLRNSARGEASFEFCSYFSFPPENIVTFLTPDIMGDAVQVRYWGRCYIWEMCAYIGILPLLAAFFGVFARRRDGYTAFFAGLAVLSLVLALGKYTPLLQFLYNYAPGFSFFRGHSKFILITAFSLAILCARGVDEILIVRGDALRRFSAAVLMLSLTVAIWSVAVILSPRESVALWKVVLRYSAALPRLFNLPPDLGDAAFVSGSYALAVRSCLTFSGFLLAAALLLFCRARGAVGPFSVRVLMIATVVVDLFLFGLRYMVSFSLDRAYWPVTVLDFLREDKDYFRVITVDLFENMGMVHRESNMTGYGPNSLVWYRDYIDRSQGRKIDVPCALNFSPMFNLLNVKYVLMSPGYRANEKYFPLKVETPSMRVYLNGNFLPRTRLVHAMRIVPEKEVLGELLSPSFDPRGSVVLEDGDCPAPEGGAGAPGGEDARIESCSPNRVVVRARASGSAYLILADTWYPGWKAFVDGKEAKIYRANYVQRAVYLGPGEHTVEFTYFPFTFKIGLGISVAALCGVVFAARCYRGRPFSQVN